MFLLLGFAVSGLIGGAYYLYKVHNPEPIFTPPQIVGGMMARTVVNRRNQSNIEGTVLLTKVNNYDDWDVSVKGVTSDSQEIELPVINDEDNFRLLYAPCRAEDLSLDKIIVTGSTDGLEYQYEFDCDQYLDLRLAIKSFEVRRAGEHNELAEVPDE